MACCEGLKREGCLVIMERSDDVGRREMGWDGRGDVEVMFRAHGGFTEWYALEEVPWQEAWCCSDSRIGARGDARGVVA